MALDPVSITLAVIAVISAGASYVQAKKAQKKAKELTEGVEANIESNSKEIPVVYGKRRVGGVRVYIDTSRDKKHQYLYMVLAMAEGEVESITDIKIDDVSIEDDRFNYDGLLSERNLEFEVFLGSDGQEASTLIGDGVSYDYDRLGEIYNDPFADQHERDAADPNRVLPWSSKHKLSGIAYLALKFKWDEGAYTGIPDVTAVVKGRKVYDPRTGTTAWSDNPALCIRDYLTNERFGKGLPASAIDDVAFSQAANDLDSFIAYPYQDSPEYQYLFRMNHVVDTSKKIMENLNDMIIACRGFIPYSKGVYSLKIDQTSSSVLDIGPDQIISGIAVAGARKEDRFNQVKVNFFNASSNYKEDQAIYPEQNSTLYQQYLAEDEGEPLVDEIDLYSIDNYYSAREMARLFLERSRQNMTIAFQGTSELINLEVGEVVSITHPTPAWTNKLFQVQEVSLAFDGTVQITCIEYDAALYTYDTPEEEQPYVGTRLPDPNQVDPPTNLTTTTGTYIEADGKAIGYIDLSWSAPEDSLVDRYELKFEYSSREEVIELASNEYRFKPTQDNISYVISVRAVNGLGIRSAWLTAAAVTAVVDTTAPSDITGINISAGLQAITLDWTNPSEDDFDLVRIKHNTTDTEPDSHSFEVRSDSFVHDIGAYSTTKHYWLAPVDRTGNVGNYVSGGFATTGSIDYSDVGNTPTIPEVATTAYLTLSDSNAPTDTEFNTAVGRDPIENDFVVVSYMVETVTNTKAYVYKTVAPAIEPDWTEVTEYIDGSMIVTGSLSASDITTGTLNANDVTISNLTIGYDSVTNPPTIPSNVSDLTNDTGFVTSVAWNELTGTAPSVTTFSGAVQQSDIDDSIDDITISGRNLVSVISMDGVATDGVYGGNKYARKLLRNNSNYRIDNWDGTSTERPTGKYSLSFWAKVNDSSDNPLASDLNMSVDIGDQNSTAFTINSDWQQYKIEDANVTNYLDNPYYGFIDLFVTGNVMLYVSNVKLEYGTKATEWSPAPEDVETPQWWKLTGRTNTNAPSNADFRTAFKRFPVTGDILLVEDTSSNTKNYQYQNTAWSQISALINGSMLVTDSITALGAVTAGTFNLGNGNFNVDTSGVLNATGAIIDGDITATSIDVENATVTGTFIAPIGWNNSVYNGVINRGNLSESVKDLIDERIAEVTGGIEGDFGQDDGGFSHIAQGNPDPDNPLVSNITHENGKNLTIELSGNRSWTRTFIGLPDVDMGVSITIERSLAGADSWTSLVTLTDSGSSITTDTYLVHSGTQGYSISIYHVISEDPASGNYDYRARTTIADSAYTVTVPLELTVVEPATVGAGNADTLDNQDGTYYLNYNNFTNTPTLITQSDIDTAISNLVDTSPTTLDTLNELAEALGDDPNFAATTATSIGTKASKAGDTFTGKVIYQGRTTDSGGSSTYVGTGTRLNEYLTNVATEYVSGNDEPVTIYFKSGVNAPSDFAYITYDPDYDDSGENGALVIGSENDGTGSSDYVRIQSRLVIDSNMHSSDSPYIAEFHSAGVQKGYINTSGNLQLDGTITASGYNKTNWDTAYGWGNHADAGYLTVESYENLQQLTFNVNQADSSTSSNYNIQGVKYSNGRILAVQNITGYTGNSTEFRWRFRDLGEASPSSQTLMSLTPTAFDSADLDVSGSITATGYNDSNWNTAYGWGDHGSAGYLKKASLGQIGDSDVTFGSTTNWANNPVAGFYKTDYVGYSGLVFMSGDVGGSTSSIGMEFSYSGNFYIHSNTDSNQWTSHKVWTSKDISATNVSNWNTAYGWGDHGDANYIVGGGTWTGGTGSSYTTLAQSVFATGNTKFTFYGNSGKMDVIADGEFYANEGGSRVFHDTYHPNADKWTTASTLSLTGDVTGSVSWDGSANASITATVANDSHTHDGRYYTETESDSRFVNITGDTMTGDLNFSAQANRAIKIDTTVADNETRDAIELFENDGQATGRQAISWWNDDRDYYKARLWTEVGDSYNATKFGIDVADNARAVATRLFIQDGNTYVTGSFLGSKSIRIGAGGSYQAGSIYSDGNWGMIFRGAQSSPNNAEFRWANSADTELMRIDNSGNLDLESGGYRINGTTVIDSSRNLTNIGTISSGNITGGDANFNHIGVRNTSNTSGDGISLYNGATGGQPTYGLMFSGTPTYGTHGGVSGDWATYFTMSDNTNRGWIFKRGTTNVASIDGSGDARFDGTLSVGSGISGNSISVTNDGAIGNKLYVGSDDDYIRVGGGGGGKSGVFGNRMSNNGSNLSYGAYLAYDAYWNGSAWQANRTTLTRKWMTHIGGYHDDNFHINRYGGSASGTWADSAWTRLLTLNSSGSLTVSGNVKSSYSGTNYSQLESNASGGVLKLEGGGTTLLRSYGLSEFPNGIGIGSTTVIDSSRNATFSKVTSSYGLFGNVQTQPSGNTRLVVSNGSNPYAVDGGDVQALIGGSTIYNVVYSGSYNGLVLTNNWRGSNKVVTGLPSWGMDIGGRSTSTGNLDQFTITRIAPNSTTVTKLANVNNSGILNTVGGYQVNGTSVINSSRNIDGAGRLRITGGNNTDGNAQSSTGAVIGTYVDQYAFIDLASSHANGSWIDFSYADGGDYKGRIRYKNSSGIFEFHANGSSSANMSLGTSYMEMYGGIRADEYRINSTTVIDSSRNATFNTVQTSGTNIIDNNGSLGVKNSSDTTGRGLSLYGGAVSGMPTYGLAFAGTYTFGTHGGVSGSWATYFTMNDDVNRGWIFKRGTTNVASISGSGHAKFEGYTEANNGLQVFRNLGNQIGNWPTAEHTMSLENSDAGWLSINFHRAGYTSDSLYCTGSSFNFTDNLNLTSGGYQIGSTTVIDSSRNMYPNVIDMSSGHAQGYKFHGRSFSWNSAMQSPTTKMPHIWQENYSGWDPILGIKTYNGFWQMGAYSSNKIHFGYMAGAYGTHGTNGFDTSIAISPTQFKVGDVGSMSIVASGNITAYSDARLKDNVKTLDGSKVYEMRGVSFTKDGELGSGVIAQELEKVAPELVMTNDDEMQTKSVAYGNVVGYLIEAIKELKSEIEELKNGTNSN